MKQIPRLHIVGRKNAGKTTLVCELVLELSRLGYSVATIKHTHHHHELDTPGKDSHKHREAGAAGVGILSSQMTAVFIPVTRKDNETDRYRRFNTLFQDCDLILVEGDLHASAVKLEVWRSAASEAPYAASQAEILAVVTDDPVTLNCSVLPRRDIGTLASSVLKYAGL
ncbi:MAG: molybdopterin-guanine dinucleotide biosynthesis protein B [Planctomycetaceae bacterium]